MKPTDNHDVEDKKHHISCRLIGNCRADKPLKQRHHLAVLLHYGLSVVRQANRQRF